MPAHIYLRVSTDEQAEDGFSLQAQERACRLFCELHTHAVAAVYQDDGYSGTNGVRPALVRLLANVQPGDLVVVHRLDRLARNTHLLLDLVQGWEQRGVHLVSVSEQIDFSSPIGRVMLNLLAAFAQYYVDNLRQETSKGLREKAQRGLWVGAVPFGYRKVDRGRLEPSEDAPVVREIYRLYVESGLSYKGIADELNRRGLTAYNWRSGTRGLWGRENVRVILRNRAYLGKVSAGAGELDGLHEPLITEATWAAAAARRAAGTVEPNGGPRPPSWANGRLFCARCGRRLWFRYGRAGSELRYYYCRGVQKGICTAGATRVDLIEHQVRDLLDLLGLDLDELPEVVEGVYVEEEEIAYLSSSPKYRRLFEALGYKPSPFSSS